MESFIKAEVAVGDKIHRLDFSTKKIFEEYVDSLVKLYIEKTGCGETGEECVTCKVGAAHEDDESPGLKCVDNAFNAGAGAIRKQFAEFGLYVMITGYNSKTPDIELMTDSEERMLRAIRAWVPEEVDSTSDNDIRRQMNQPGGNLFGDVFVKKVRVQS